ncbi:cellobiose dehydrogenase [Fusarium napiforme]|uniref:Cellobiose dehydrogenase n=1 Tax=Fusarium napiforme TaxID=42672 RepID=A0A8H5JQQ8_9HYPO|nr:cellobiose dehydrogenase [Fusarium napiforme]
MLLRKLGHALAATAALFPVAFAKEKDEGGQSTFVSPDGDVAFAIDIGENANTEVYFSLRVKKNRSWGAVGLGSEDMPGALFLMVYKSRTTNNVTFSPRLAYGHYEPYFWDEMDYEVLNTTGIIDDHMVATIRCKSGCRSWPSHGGQKGYLDVYDHNSKAVFAFGPKEDYYSDDTDAPLKYHAGYGSFSLDIKRTHGKSELPSLSDSTKDVGSELIYATKAKPNWASPLHGVFMVLSIIFLMPIGVVLLRSGGWVKWHALNQSIATLGVFAGFGIGVANSFYYQRSRSFDDPHQIIGFVVTGLLLGQFGLGVMHHTQYKRTQAPTKYGKFHLWVGRIILFLGTLNAFLGFTFALNRKFGMLLALLIIFICISSLILIYGRRYMDKRRLGPRGPGLAGPQQYSAPPWREPPPQHMGYPSDPPPGYQPPSNQAGLGQMSPALRSPSPWQSNDKDDEADLNLGREQRPREF